SIQSQFYAAQGLETLPPSLPSYETSVFGKAKREYGWSAFGVYLALSALDFPLCLLLVRHLGADKIGELEDHIISTVDKIIPDQIQKIYYEAKTSIIQPKDQRFCEEQVVESGGNTGLKMEDNERNKKNASIATQLALAYAIHKSFIFFRVPLTAAVTPKIVKTLRSWGWNIGKRAKN
ncbi:BgTH12-06633, partial [Blumeria graminis f. sp. triticale]